jgi:hypothetical protein
MLAAGLVAGFVGGGSAQAVSGAQEVEHLAELA